MQFSYATVREPQTWGDNMHPHLLLCFYSLSLSHLVLWVARTEAEVTAAHRAHVP